MRAKWMQVSGGISVEAIWTYPQLTELDRNTEAVLNLRTLRSRAPPCPGIVFNQITFYLIKKHFNGFFNFLSDKTMLKMQQQLYIGVERKSPTMYFISIITHTHVLVKATQNVKTWVLPLLSNKLTSVPAKGVAKTINLLCNHSTKLPCRRGLVVSSPPATEKTEGGS
jgi:hypothetical protein